MNSDNNQTIKGVCCDVKNCVHNNCASGCTAHDVKVGPTFATTTNDTICQTFKQKANG